MTNFAIARKKPARNLLILEENIIGVSGARNWSPQGAAFVLKCELRGRRLRSRYTVRAAPSPSI